MKTPTPTSQQCKERITSDGWHFRPCGKPIKREFEGTGYCGVHARVKEQATLKRAAWQAELTAGKYQGERIEVLLNQLRGLDIDVHKNWTPSDGASITLTEAGAADLIERLTDTMSTIGCDVNLPVPTCQRCADRDNELEGR